MTVEVLKRVLRESYKSLFKGSFEERTRGVDLCVGFIYHLPSVVLMRPDKRWVYNPNVPTLGERESLTMLGGRAGIRQPKAIVFNWMIGKKALLFEKTAAGMVTIYPDFPSKYTIRGSI